MPIQTDSLNRRLYDILHTAGYDPMPKDSDPKNAEKVVPPEEADVIEFTFTSDDGQHTEKAWVSIPGANTLVLYYDDDMADNQEWDGLRNHLKNWAMRKQLGFELTNQDRLNSDMAQRTYMKNKEKLKEGYYPMGKQASYSDAIPTVKIVLQHTRQVQEGEQRFRNVAKIFLENTAGERILAPTSRPGIAQIYARHIAEGGVPNDERWNHIKSLCEEYSKMAGFVRAVRGNQFNESAQKLVEAGLSHYQSLRESLGRMRGHRGYNAYFESWSPPLMEADGEETNLNELFVQETLDPRIESVMPILSKLNKNLGEMREVKELAEWAQGITELKEPDPISNEEFRTKMTVLQKIQLDPATSTDPALKKELIQRLADLKRRAKHSGIEVVEDESLTSNNPVGIPENDDSSAHRDYADKDWLTKGKTPPSSLTHKLKDTLKGIKGFVTGKEQEMLRRGELDTYEGVAEAAKWRADDKEGKTWRSPDWDDGDLSPSKIKIDRSGKDVDGFGDELTSRPGAWRGKADMAKRMTKKGVPTKSELAFQNNLKMRMRMKKKEGGLTGPKGVLPEQGVAEGLDPDTQRLEQEVRDALANGDDYTAKSLVKMAQTAADRNYLRKIIRQEMYGTGPGQGGVAEGGYQDDSKEREENLRYSRSCSPVADAIRKKLNPNQKEQNKEQGVAEALKGDMHPEADKVLKHIDPKFHEVYKPYLKAGVYKGDYQDRADVLSAAERAGHINKQQGVAEDSDSLTFWKREAQKAGGAANIDWYAIGVEHGKQGILMNPPYGVGAKAVNLYSKGLDAGEKGVAEDLDADQKRAGQLGPTETVKNNNIGKLVGANESVELSEMDSEGHKGHRGDEDSGKGPEKSVKPVKAKDAAEDAEKELNKSMDKAHKKDVKEGQEDLDAILRIIRK